MAWGLSPHSRNEKITPRDERDCYEQRLGYFDTEKMPHGLHTKFGLVLRGLKGLTKQGLNSRWLHEIGYVTADLSPYYIGSGSISGKEWSDDVVFPVLKQHFLDVMTLFRDHLVRLVVFSGAPWVDLLIDNPKKKRVCEFQEDEESQFTFYPARKKVDFSVHLGRLHLTQDVPAVVLGRFIGGRWGITDDDAYRLGIEIGRRPWATSLGGCQAPRITT